MLYQRKRPFLYHFAQPQKSCIKEKLNDETENSFSLSHHRSVGIQLDCQSSIDSATKRFNQCLTYSVFDSKLICSRRREGERGRGTDFASVSSQFRVKVNANVSLSCQCQIKTFANGRPLYRSTIGSLPTESMSYQNSMAKFYTRPPKIKDQGKNNTRTIYKKASQCASKVHLPLQLTAKGMPLPYHVLSSQEGLYTPM